MSVIAKVILALSFTVAIVSSSSIREPDTDELNFEDMKEVHPLSTSLARNKREDIIKFLIDAVDDDIDQCGSPLQIQNDQVTISVQSLTCIVQALVDSLNAGPGLLRTLIDNVLKKRDLTDVEMKTPLTRAEQECAVKAIIKEAIQVVKSEHSANRGQRRHKRRAHNANNRCAQIEKDIEKAMKTQIKTKN